jgi:crotonobetainyl-CoA:carnitine CoA-transferase CaiB-like acyl-CoA transferase
MKVLDISQLLPGPFCTWILAEFGAEVLRLEPLNGESGHRLPPTIGTTSLFCMALNRGKQSILIDLKQEEGAQIFSQLASGSDVLVEGFRPGTMDRLGLGYEQLRKINPRLVYCAITGYGQDGPRCHTVGHDLNYLAVSGILGMQAEVAAPGLIPVQIADLGGGAWPAIAGILLALSLREKTGTGSFVDISMLDGLLAWMAPFAGQADCPWTRHPMLRGELACYNLYSTADGRYLSVGCVEPKFWRALCKALGHEEWIPRQLETGKAQEQIRRDLQMIFAGRSAEEWRQLFSGVETCVEVVLSPEEMQADPQVLQRGSVYTDEKENPALRHVRVPIRISGSEPNAYSAPMPGQDTESVLRRLGYSQQQIGELIRRRVVAVSLAADTATNGH